MKPNKELLRKTMNYIIEHPEEHNQDAWHCGSAHCFAGIGQILAGFKESDFDIGPQMAEAFGIRGFVADYLFSGRRTKPELRRAVKMLLEDELDDECKDKAGKSMQFRPLPESNDLELL